MSRYSFDLALLNALLFWERDLHFVDSNAFQQHLMANVETDFLPDYFSALQIISRVTDRSWEARSAVVCRGGMILYMMTS